MIYILLGLWAVLALIIWIVLWVALCVGAWMDRRRFCAGGTEGRKHARCRRLDNPYVVDADLTVAVPERPETPAPNFRKGLWNTH